MYLSPRFFSADSLVVALYNRNTRMLSFLVVVISLNFINSAFWASMMIHKTVSIGPCVAEKPPLTTVYLA